MSGSKWSARVPNDLDSDLIEYKQKNGIDDQSEAARQVFRKGIEQWREERREERKQERWLTWEGLFYRFTELAVVSTVLAILLAIGLNDGQLMTVAGVGVATTALSAAGYALSTNNESFSGFRA